MSQALAGLIACAGKWTGTNKLQDPTMGIADDSEGTATVMPVCGNRFVRVDYTWAYKQKPQEGSILVGFEGSDNAATAYWIDSWHMGDKGMLCRGTASGGELSVRGSYAAPPGPDWGWRIVLTPGSHSLRIVMYNITPNGQEDLAVEAVYRRA